MDRLFFTGAFQAEQNPPRTLKHKSRETLYLQGFPAFGTSENTQDFNQKFCARYYDLGLFYYDLYFFPNFLLTNPKSCALIPPSCRINKILKEKLKETRKNVLF